MKKIILLTGFLFVAVNAHALIIYDMQYTGNTAERIDICGYGCGVGSPGGSIGGPVANNSLGGAFQFEVTESMQVEYLLADAHVNAFLDDQTEDMEFYFKLYTGTLNAYHDDPSGPYPDVSTLALTAPMYVTTYTEDVYIPELGIWHTVTRDGNYTGVIIPFEYTFQPGTYWIARERNYGQGGPIVDGISVELAKGGLNSTITNPEPATLLLLGLGLLGAGFIRRKTG